MTNEEIERLKKKVEKDPLSKFIVPLAEEYKNKGMVDEAISLLLTALENRPDYTSARVALGKIYIDKDMLSEARDEFEKVINQISDNLFAHKRLADIYYRQEEFDRAVEEYKIILNMDPGDENATAMMLSLQSRKEKVDTPGPPDSGTKSRQEPTPGENTKDVKDSTDTVEQDVAEISPEKTKEIPVYEIDKETDGSDLGIEIPEKLTPVAEEPVTKELEEYKKIKDTHSEESPAAETMQKEPENSDQIHVSPSVTKKIKKNRKDKSDLTRPHGDKIVISMPTDTMADIFITQGLYDKAMNVYKELLSSDPANKRIIQRCEELKMLMKIIDKKIKQPGN